MALRKKQTQTWEGKYARTAGVGRKSNHTTNKRYFLFYRDLGKRRGLRWQKRRGKGVLIRYTRVKKAGKEGWSVW